MMRGRVALVTGGTRGLGAAITQRLAADGLHVAAVYASDDARAEIFANEAAAIGSVSVHRCDISENASCVDLVGEITQQFGGIDYLVNNAGLLVEERIDRIGADTWDRALAVNLSGSFFLAQAVWQHMVAQQFGRIVNISSVTAFMGNPREAAYGAAKAGLHGLTRSLALAGARRGITVNCVVPGVYATDMTAAMSEKEQEAIKAMIPIGRHGRPEELAHTVRHLLDDLAGYLTGAVLVIDGGLSMGS